MKKLKLTLLATALMLAGISFAQDTTRFRLGTSFNEVLKINDTLPTTPLYLAPVAVHGVNIHKISKASFFGKEVNTEILEIRANGDIYYKPAAFCDCDKCKAFKGMRFLMNFLSNQSK